MKDSLNDKREYTVYVYQGITYVPHYQDAAKYVGPGYPRFTDKVYTAHELLDAGAKPQQLMLSPRPEYAQKVVA